MRAFSFAALLPNAPGIYGSLSACSIFSCEKTCKGRPPDRLLVFHVVTASIRCLVLFCHLCGIRYCCCLLVCGIRIHLDHIKDFIPAHLQFAPEVTFHIKGI